MKILLNFDGLRTSINIMKQICESCFNALEKNGSFCEIILLIFINIKHMDTLIKNISRSHSS